MWGRERVSINGQHAPGALEKHDEGMGGGMGWAGGSMISPAYGFQEPATAPGSFRTSLESESKASLSQVVTTGKA